MAENLFVDFPLVPDFSKYMFKKWRKNKAQTANSPAQSLDTVVGLIREIMGEQLPPNLSLNADTQLTAIGFDSINYINLVLSLEDLLNVEMEKILQDVDITDFQTIGDIANFVDDFPKS